jgi:hypothetical protein
MNDWRNVKLNDVDLSLIEITSKMKCNVRKFLGEAQTQGIEIPIYALEKNRWGGVDCIGYNTVRCKTIGDLVACGIENLFYSFVGIGKKTIQFIGKLINVIAGEIIFTNKQLQIPKSLEEHKVETQARHKIAYEMRQAGYSWDIICDKLKVEKQTAKNMATNYRIKNNFPNNPHFQTPRAWQPIETAPKNGTKILLYGRGSVYKQWNVCFWETEDDITGQENSFWWGWNWPEYEPPTHWMLLPEEPQ